jgi:hypothetical protein
MMSNTYTNRRRQAVLEAQTAAAVKREQEDDPSRRNEDCPICGASPSHLTTKELDVMDCPWWEVACSH